MTGRFSEEGVLRGVALSDDGMEQAGMGVGVGDYDLDGHLDIFKTHFAEDANGLYHNDGKGNFDDVTRSSRVGVETRYVCWGAGMVDLDNDGYPGYFHGHGQRVPGGRAQAAAISQQDAARRVSKPGQWHLRRIGRPRPVPGLTDAHCSRGCAFGDFDNDGDLDILIVNLNEPPSLLRNDLKRQAELDQGQAARA